MLEDTLLRLVRGRPREPAPNAPPEDVLRHQLELALAREPHVCPKCLGTDLARVGTRDFTVYGNRKCRQCGCLWTPAWPKWAGAVVLVFGLMFILPFLFLPVWAIHHWLQGAPDDLPYGPYGAEGVLGLPGGILFAWFGLGILRGTHGRVTVHEVGMHPDQGRRLGR